MKTIYQSAVLILTLQLGACQADKQTESLKFEPASGVHIDLRIRKNSGEPYLATQNLSVPKHHKIHDDMFPYEGIGWENEFIGYRLFLDKRTSIDIFGKQKPDKVLSKIDENSGSYHTLAQWGMDILHVGPSRGLGGLGKIIDGYPVQLGEMDDMFVSVHDSNETQSGFTINYHGVNFENEKADLTVDYSMSALSPLTNVHVKITKGKLPTTTGIVAHKNAVLMHTGTFPWRYIASFGQQSENGDNLGLALFFRPDQAHYKGTKNETHFIMFTQEEFDYKFLAVWEKDKSGVKTRLEFETYLTKMLERLNTAP